MLRRNALAHDTFWSVLNEVAALVATTVSFTLLGIHLGPKGYGAFLGSAAVVGTLSAFTTGGTFLALLDHMKRGGRRPFDVARSCLSLAGTLGLAATGLAFTIVIFSVKTISWQTVLLLAGGDLVFLSMATTAVGVIQIEEGFPSAARARIGYQLARVVMLAVLWQTGNLQLFRYALCQTSLSFVYLIAVSILVHRFYHRTALFGRPHKADLKLLVSYSTGLSALSVQNDGDNFALNKFGYAEDAGRYGFAYRLVQLGLLPVNAFVGATHVSFLDPNSPLTPLARAIKFAKLAVIYVIAVSIFLWFAAPLAPKLLGHNFHGSDVIMRWIIPLIFLRGIGTFAMNGILGLGLNRLRTQILVVNALFAAGLYVWLVPDHSWKGAAIATQISEVSLFAAGWGALVFHQRRADRRGTPLVEEFSETDLALESLEQTESM